ncbi:MAG: hypothetical protein ACKON7_05615 [Planctomycetaceae bacterium]
MDARITPRRGGLRSHPILRAWATAVVLTIIGAVHADESPPPRAFEPGELSIG